MTKRHSEVWHDCAGWSAGRRTDTPRVSSRTNCCSNEIQQDCTQYARRSAPVGFQARGNQTAFQQFALRARGMSTTRGGESHRRSAGRMACPVSIVARKPLPTDTISDRVIVAEIHRAPIAQTIKLSILARLTGALLPSCSQLRRESTGPSRDPRLELCGKLQHNHRNQPKRGIIA